MNERRCKPEHLRPYQGVLSSEVQNGRFKMELKVEENPVLQRSKEIEPSIELEFIYDYSYSLQFFHNIHSCQIENCSVCETTRKRYSKVETDLSSLQLGDTFKISASLMSNNYSDLQQEIGDFKAYGPLLVACPEYYNQGSLRLPDTIEGINKKREYMEQKEREVEEEEKKAKEKEEEEAERLKKQRWRNRFDRFEQYPNTVKIIITVLITTFANQIPFIVKVLKNIFQFFKG